MLTFDIGNCPTLPNQNSVALSCHVVRVHMYMFLLIPLILFIPLIYLLTVILSEHITEKQITNSQQRQLYDIFPGRPRVNAFQKLVSS